MMITVENKSDPIILAAFKYLSERHYAIWSTYLVIEENTRWEAAKWLAKQYVEVSRELEKGRGVDVDNTPGRDGTPAWAYDEDGYCVCCGNGRWKHHMPECDLRDALDCKRSNIDGTD